MAISSSTIGGAKGMLSKQNGGARGQKRATMMTVTEFKQLYPNRHARRAAKKFGIVLDEAPETPREAVVRILSAKVAQS